MSSVLVDTSIWVAHFRTPNHALRTLLESDQVACHPFIITEIACGSPPSRARTLAHLRALRRVTIATTEEILSLIEREQLHNRGCGAVDVALLASALLTPGVRLWTADKSLQSLSQKLSIDHGHIGLR